MARVAFIGLGTMGLGMAGRLLAAGHALQVYNRTAARADALIERGATSFATPGRACRGVDAVVVMVADDAASRAVWLGPDGILAADLGADAFGMECSTLSHGWVRELSAACNARGLRYLDAPVTGLPDAAAAGTLTLLVGADPQELERARAVLDALASRVIRFGSVGAGTAYKLLINLIGAVQIASVAEGLAIAERAGLDLAGVAEAIATSQAASPQVVRNTRRMLAADHDRNIVFTAALRLKDVQYGLEFARSLGVGTPFGAVAESVYRQLCSNGYAQVNESKIIDVSRAQAP
jgi:3-hydroxyisobutyrate dehydrogenase